MMMMLCDVITLEMPKWLWEDTGEEATLRLCCHLTARKQNIRAVSDLSPGAKRQGMPLSRMLHKPSTTTLRGQKS